MAKEDSLVRYTLRVNRVMFRKFRYIVDSEGRSANRDIEQYIKRRVRAYEEQNSPIDLADCPD